MLGIFTFHRAKNYGAVLQAYALQQTLKTLGKDSVIIDYRCKKIEDRYKLFPLNKNDLFKSFIKSLVAFPIRLKKNYGYDRFLNRYLSISKSYFTIEDIKRDSNNYSAFITGSDQVFRVSDERFDEVYFLNFAKSEQKYSYAASFGVDKIDNKFEDRVANLLKDFQDISLREDNGKRIVEDLVNFNARVDLDPTLLLDSNKWSDICKYKKTKSPYVLVYNVNPYNNLMNFALSMAKQKGLKVVYIKDGFVRLNYDVNIKRGISPLEFISLFKFADSVVTNSFHGTAFSIIFNKDFYVELDTGSGRNLRSEAILDSLEITNREIKTKEFNKNDYDKINWNRAMEIIELKREYAFEYLKKIK